DKRRRPNMSHHCHDEHAGEGGHHHHGHDHDHDHSDDITPALQFSLYQHINFDEIHTLNEAHHGSGRAIVQKEWTRRLSDEPELQSDADEQVIINVPCVLSPPPSPLLCPYLCVDGTFTLFA
ncbi:MAG: PITH domain-containing protein, partial [Thaumarchaeota archaeon]|nr:PITH domain-containing protein [Nitrososphaerota archaeon]